MRWELLDVDVRVKEFGQREAQSLIHGKRFQNQDAYEQYIIMHCVTNLSELVPIMSAFLDQMANEGKFLHEQDLNHELFLMASTANPLLLVDVEGGGGLQIESRTPQGKQDKSCDYACGASEEPVQTKKLEDVDLKDVLSLGDRMKQWVVGQDEAVDRLHKATMIGFTGLKPTEQPVGNYLLLGNTGVGKTYTAEVFNDCFIGDQEAFHQLDMSEYAEGHEYTKLIGSPSGYRGHERGGILTNAVGSHPFCTVLADEIEEAHERVRKIFLQIMDSGRLTDGQGNTVTFGSATIIMTTNIGTEAVIQHEGRTGFISGKINQKEKKDTLFAEVDRFFPRKFLNRLDDVIFFRDLTRDEYWEISKLELAKITRIISSNRQIVVTSSDEVITWIRDNGIDEVYGARPLKRFIKKNFSTPLSIMLLERDIEDGDKLIADIHKGKLVFEKDKA
ncbi:MAG: ATP-dependent Clp protease ATP-binding subunit [Thermoplasmata archaeon]|nr:ATP-dependent Clp protease ATP-binding subunit [Thermoplasmata archaeon]